MDFLAIVGTWLSIFLTLSILSFLYDDNPIYKLAEHLFMGLGIGIGTIEVYYGVFQPKLVHPLLEEHRYLSLCPLILLALLFTKLTRKHQDWARIPIAFIVAAFAGIKLTGEANGRLLEQVRASMPDLPALYEEHGLWNWDQAGAGVISGVILVLGLCACLLHFYFSARHNKTMQTISRVGILTLMLSFGASFGFTVMGRISLAIGRAETLLGLDQPNTLISLGSLEVERMTATRWTSFLTLLLIIAIIALLRRRSAGAEAGS
ncbi:MAG: hypothetical protein CMP23_12890 [Rickettsiales bacterium]|nr:hypothetical protein [Rickettsiales bacterium]